MENSSKNTPAILTKSNRFTRGFFSLTLQETRLLNFAIYNYVNNNNIFFSHQGLAYTQVNVVDFSDFFDVAKDSLFTEIEKTVNKLFDRVVYFFDGEKYIKRHLLSTIEVDKKEGSVALALHPEILSEIGFDKKLGHFTQIDLRMFKEIKSTSTWRVFEFLLSWRTKKSKTIATKVELSTFKKMLGLNTGMETSKISAKIKSIQKDFEKYGLGVLNFEKVVTNRKIVGFKFEFFPAKNDARIHKNDVSGFFEEF